MLLLTPADVTMNAYAADKAQALALLAKILSDDGFTAPEYLTGLQNREQQASTYLGQGIAIPHGTPDSRIHIHKTGVRLVHFADGVVWNDDGDKVYLAVAVAAKSDEHLTVLKLLTKALSDDIALLIKSAKTADELIAVMTSTPNSLLVHERFIKTGVAAKDIDELYLTATSLLKSQGVLTALAGTEPKWLRLSKALYAVVIESKTINEPVFSLVTSKNPIKYHKDNVYGLVVVASNYHVDVEKLSSLYDQLMADDFVQTLGMASTKELAVALGAQLNEDWQSMSVILPNAHGLHARPATVLSNIAKEATGEIKVALEQGAYVSAKSLTRLLSLGATKGQRLTFIAQPNTDAVAFLPKLVQAVEEGLGEEIDVKITPILQETLVFESKTVIVDGQKTVATSASGGIADGVAYLSCPMQFSYPMTASDPKEELARLNLAIDDVKEDLKLLVQNATKSSIAQIFTAHIALLEDEEIIHGAKDGIDEGLSAAAAWHAHIEQMAKTQSSVANHLLAQRAADLRDIGQKVLIQLTGQQSSHKPTQPYILVKEDLLPSDVANLDTELVAGILTAVGGASSHSAIVARALGIPAVVGAGMDVLGIQDGVRLLLDGTEGWFVVNPSHELVQACKQRQQELATQKALADAHALEPAITQDGHQVEIAVNIGNVNDTAGAVACGAEAVGLLRTELVFMAHQSVPDIDTQVSDYNKVFDALAGRPLVVRTLDVGGDKPLPYLPLPAEENPFLGVRGIRLSLRQPQLLKNQLIALIRASQGRDLRIMFPMVGRFEEWQAAKAILKEVRQKYTHDNLQVGIMVEVPSVAIMAHRFAKEVDFFSIGTNDLTQYTLAIDRGHSLLSKEADGLHPAVLTLIDQTVKAAHAHGKWVGVCGELAGDKVAVPILIGLGVDELSMSSSSIAMTKALIRQLTQTECQALAKRALTCTTADEVRALA